MFSAPEITTSIGEETTVGEATTLPTTEKTTTLPKTTLDPELSDPEFEGVPVMDEVLVPGTIVCSEILASACWVLLDVL